MKAWQWVLLIAAAVIAVAAIVVCGVLLGKQQKALDESVSVMATVNETLEQAKAERDSYKAAAEKSEQENTALQEKLDALEKKIKELEEKLKASESEQKKLKDKNASLQQQIDLMAAKKKTQSAAAAKPVPGKVCYLTFDDGPSKNTLKILDTLKKYKVKATFFVVGSSDLEYVDEIYEQGHALALHCNDHTYAKVYASETAYLKDLKAISKKVEDKTGVKSMVVRFPGGSSNTVSRKHTRGLMTKLSKLLPEMGYAYFDWNVDSGDADGGRQSASRITSNVLTRAKGLDKICVLMHDGADKATTAAALPAIIEGLKKQGYSFEVLTTDVTGFKHGINN